MRALRRFALRLANFFGRDDADREFASEVAAHLALMQEEFERQGMAPHEALREAYLKLGGVEQAKELHREGRTLRGLETLGQDVRFAFRMLRKNVGFTIVAVLTLALGIGANTAIFSVVNAVLLNPLPYPNPDQLVEVAEHVPSFTESSISYPNFLDWVRQNRTFESLAAYRENEFNLTSAGDAIDVKAMQVSASFFPLLGVEPLLGRNFSPDEDTRGAAPVAMLSYGLWKSKFGGSPGVIGTTLDLDGTPYTVVGVTPPNFYFCCEAINFRLADVYLPIGIVNGLYDRADHPGDFAVGRLKPGVTLEQARADMSIVSRNLAAAYPDVDKEVGVSISPLKERMVQDVKPMLLVVLFAVGFVLLIACVNVANLLLARSSSRAKEFAVRAALGASQTRIVRQLLTESLLLAIGGAGLGLMLVMSGTQTVLRALPEALPRANRAHVDAHVLLFTLAAAVLSGVLFGITPALRTSRPDVQEALTEGGRGTSGGRYRTQRIFVVSELALAVVLMIGAGLTIRSLARLWAINPGFDSKSVMTFTIALPPKTSQTADEIRDRARQLTDNIAAIPGVEAAALTDGSEPMCCDNDWPFWLEGGPKPTRSEMPEALAYVVSPDYWKVMRIPLLRGRLLTRGDDAHSRFAGVIDENFARTYFPGQDPVGKVLNIDGAYMDPSLLQEHLKRGALE